MHTTWPRTIVVHWSDTAFVAAIDSRNVIGALRLSKERWQFAISIAQMMFGLLLRSKGAEVVFVGLPLDVPQQMRICTEDGAPLGVGALSEVRSCIDDCGWFLRIFAQSQWPR